MARCDRCEGRAVIHQRYSGMHLCRSHFDSDLQRRIRESIRATGLFSHEARVAVLIDGIKGMVLLHAMRRLFERRRDTELMALIVDAGEELTGEAVKLAEGLHLPWTNLRAPEWDVGRLAEAAMDAGADILATGHSLDDEALEVFVCCLQGDPDGLLPLRDTGAEWIRPLRRIPEREIRLYASQHGLRLYGGRQHEDAFRAEARRHLLAFDSRHPGTMYSLQRGLDRILAFYDGGRGKPF